jgi:toxin-antitoxin system PIN domain toxin
VILIDANILIYAQNEDAPSHHQARVWLDGQLGGLARVGLPWGSLLAFLRVTTNPRIYRHPVPMDVALAQVADWLSADPVWIPQPMERHLDILDNLLSGQSLFGNLVSDAHLAALAIEHGLTLCSTDSDFARFSGLQWVNPLVP